MSQDGKDPPTPEPGARGGQRPALRVIMGGGDGVSPPSQPPLLTQSSISDDARARLVRVVRALGAERAFLFVWDEEEFTLSEACAIDPSGNVPEDRSVMWSLLDGVTSKRVPIALTGTDDQPREALMSGVTAPMRMGIAAPLTAQGQLKGVACFDKRIHKGIYAETDAQAVAGLLSALNIDAMHLSAMRRGAPLPEACTTVELAQAVRDALSCDAVAQSAQLAPPCVDELTFATGGASADGTKRHVLFRLVMHEAKDDLLVHHFLACMRSFAFPAEGSVPDLLEGLTFELGRTKQAPFELHVTALEHRPDAPTWRSWHAGTGALLIVHRDGSVDVTPAQHAPLTREQRKVLPLEHASVPDAKFICVHGARATAHGALPFMSALKRALPAQGLARTFTRVLSPLSSDGVSSWLITP